MGVLLAHLAVAVVVPISEQVDHAHRVVDQDLAQLLLHVAIGVELYLVRVRARARVRARVRVTWLGLGLGLPG